MKKILLKQFELWLDVGLFKINLIVDCRGINTTRLRFQLDIILPIRCLACILITYFGWYEKIFRKFKTLTKQT